ncbi:aminoglycoside phosphotransferase family protein [Jiangella asiatica]|uniref:Kinase n=1 Tax=Jiangella asiatica TaxID=2530372 RepID=A0A4R5DL47_9ACTN|nr:aminoglycoside phosphotransferase family protein [Jiangella asiatica]TDE12701.1 kinase [Jiangella asiatica]
MPRWWHDRPGRQWLGTLPSLVSAQCRRWDLRIDGEPMHGSNALIVPVRRRREPYVLRLSPPGDNIDQEAAALHFWAGRGTVRLFDVDRGSRAMLLERLDSSRSLQSQPLTIAVPILAHLVGVLAVPAPADVLSTATIAAGHVETFERDWLAVEGPTPRSQLTTAIQLAEERSEAPTSDLAVDGDLHCAQVLAAKRAPWLIVDPVLLRGDREYDFARVLWDRLDELSKDSEIIAAFDAFVDAAQVPAQRARCWVVLRSMSYLLWGIPHGLTSDPPKCRRLLDLFC